MVGNSSKKSEVQSATNAAIRSIFNTDNPEFAFICGGMRRVAVDPHDWRARRMLLGKGKRYFSKNHLFIYACASLLDLDLYLDVGTNYGECLFSLPLYSKVRTRGLEANPYLHPYLEKSRALNEDLTDVRVDALAVSDVAHQTVTFFANTQWSGKSGLGLSGSKEGSQELQVTTTTIDEEVQRAGAGKTILIKIDVEGFEPSAIRGAAQTYERTPNLIYLIEFDDQFLEKFGSKAESFFRELKDQFEIYELRNNGLSPVGSYEQLKDGHTHRAKLHTDLVLTRLSEADTQQAFTDRIASRSFKHLGRKLWQLP